MKNRLPLLFGAAALTVVLNGCGESSDIVEPVIITQIQLDNSDCAGLQVGGECTIIATAISADGEQVPDALLVWRSENIVFATVSAFGVVMGVRPGTAVITVETPNRAVTASTSVLVREPPPEDEPPL